LSDGSSAHQPRSVGGVELALRRLRVCASFTPLAQGARRLVDWCYREAAPPADEQAVALHDPAPALEANSQLEG